MLRSLFTVSCALSVLCSVRADTASLRATFSKLGIDAVFPGDPSYKKFATPFNKRLTYMPAAVVFPNNTKAVSDSVKAAVEAKIPVSPRSGGHSYAAYGLGGTDGALVVDLSRINKVSVNQSTGQAVIGTGNRLGDVAIRLHSQGGRAIPHGTCPYVGIGGHAAFGGFGPTSRMWGLTSDNIISQEVVLANGTIIQASQSTNSDLFWALRGAGASYGVVTSMKFRTYAAPSHPTKFDIQWDFDPNGFANALIKFQTFCRSNLPAELGVEADLGRGSQSGRLNFALYGVWYGDSSKFPAVIQPFLNVMPAPRKRTVKKSNWLTILQGLAGSQALSTSGVDLSAEHDTFYAKSLTTPQSAPMSNSSIQAFSKYLSSEGWKTDTKWFVQFILYGGQNSAITAVAKDATAFAQRSILWTIQFYASSRNYAPPFPSAGLTFLDQMVSKIVNSNPSGWAYGAYANYVDDRLSATQWKNLYYNTHYQRLTKIKSAYDPQNVFAYPQSISKASSIQRNNKRWV
ncbi:uncharacterized protein MELLADRAFT_79848 [Melampsora larici-populina 98AG31]|uniref:FAD-binding PCMH-type domain-containing protein n=1 Tax=Melampsora larici-populina (strain 98AG31 / pathotype 3-4-7) TaxID=747676 RepID=F4SDT5_MELLP|nr:uncharacterized protein MELLADRAFT_79848 [Melampsora larici-populina 98AG31]EGF97193.1 hypothetical protein MELLADRAFT_79848 [Melampsora larici-populina 98AG31]